MDKIDACTPRFRSGDQVIYAGSIWQRWGFMYVSTVEVLHGRPVYSLIDSVWGGTLRQVRESSLRDPND